MSIAKILVPVDGSDRDAVALATAVHAAEPFKAHVEAIFAHPDPAEALPFIGVPLNAQAMSAIVGGNSKIFNLASTHIHKAIKRICGAEGAQFVSNPCRGKSVTISFCEVVGQPSDVIAGKASLSDLVVLPACEGLPRAFETAVDIVLQRKRPILLAPIIAVSFRKIMVGWDESAPAAHALSAAMPFLEMAEIVELVCLQQPDLAPFKTDDVVGYLKAHGVFCAERHLRIIGNSIYKPLAEYARDRHAGLLVVGGFGHSRIRETLFGGVTNSFLRNAPLPVLLAH